MACGAAGPRSVRLLLDEHLSPDIAEALRERGHDVVAIKERPDWLQLTDDQVIQLAHRERRGVVTNNLRDYRPRAGALVAACEGHWGMVFVPSSYRRSRRDTGRIVRALEAILSARPEDDGLSNQETWLTRAR